MRCRSLAACAGAALALAAGPPASAIAQDAGEEQYADPFENQQQQGGGGSGGGSDGSGQPAPQAPAPEPAQTSAPTTVTPDAVAAELPRTGVPAGLLAGAGGALLAGGAALRRRL
jgi:hypothetical protein